MNEQLFIQSLKDNGIALNETQIEQFRKYFELLVEWNEKMNLTAITDLEGVYLKHFFDSVSASFFFDFTKVQTLCDVGAGAGFPSIPLKICFPHLHVTIVDSLKKRITFLNHLSEQLNLTNCQFVHARAEDFGQNPDYREKFDVVTARAVARLNVLAELCIPLVKVGGHFLALKAAAADEEYKEAKKAVQVLGTTLKEQFDYHLPIENSERTIFVFEKIKKTPKKYPRKPGIPNKSPIK
ncbi:16S rRNA (guanine(527)-N(7))-methyltransferase RsmG [Ureibacillus sp. FSL K6-8385]|uniref:Ribosomal RNA small subunit methyltransferase G n=1 Tax=Ureibacillus terrenus TaxID=118246 RepID=A0A540V2X7_9BACL|nr:16S rRNA (guanine(527)-N(7))-methyltransferase RsmG [Ureibacillus terrenus]MED3661615.1 16S rRNA (guanine(527)-N(7))-methyltransferase RsmG [Ureibacillus terrenus]MED3763624.1 16S rRNA (guanine(527)-N(7))-methyltransferase RsmG [Ureibacillus terrenus]TQE91105.1 16S rRNA (guanine(527)-N(7))-methyltransferase RsmG [Ureibacillus terrenus]